MNSPVNPTPTDGNPVWKPVLNYDNTTNVYSVGTGASATSTTMSPDPAPTDPDPKKPWEMWDDGLVILNGLATALYGLIENGKIPISNPNLKQDLVAALFGLNTALHDITVAFRAYIQNDTLIVVEPPVVDQWPDPNTPAPADLPYFEAGFDILAGAMGLLSASLKEKLAAHPEGQALVDLLDALINAKEDVIANITAVLNDTTPNQPA
ncbi:hypothetical protein [Hymenobacter lucidus]|uniref:Uncharacterized protein n=1 Tax=Hymenobacter lucidus TaxID=2880930 RepID=A0ABS8AMW7_9BACT|nr:hypothetical protein [Hymenobacter lucidus]MCB2406983.1 hypothetical protein [Hymenobacter lucidus]